jgi:flagellar hook protein FlgE
VAGHLKEKHPCHSVSPQRHQRGAGDLAVTANNVANSQTTGFKQARSEFAELFAVSPQGVAARRPATASVAAVSQQFTGNIEATSNNLDLATGP